MTKPLIEFPLDYHFKVIGRSTPGFSSWVVQVVREAMMDPSVQVAVVERASTQANYTALDISLPLTSEEQRQAIYARLHGDPRVVYYL